MIENFRNFWGYDQKFQKILRLRSKIPEDFEVMIKNFKKFEVMIENFRNFWGYDQKFQKILRLRSKIPEDFEIMIKKFWGYDRKF